MKVLILVLLAISCVRRSGPPASGETSSELPKPASLPPGVFRIVETIAAADGGTRYVAKVDRGGANCAFDVVVSRAKDIAGSFFSMTMATLVRRPGADCTAFLRAMAFELGYKGELPSPTPAKEIKAAMAVLGTNQSRSPEKPEVAGSFSSTPTGHWTAGKLFLADCAGEVFLNLNVHDGIGEFSVKDEDYANIVVGELAKILLPEPV